MPILEIYSSLECPFAYAAVYRLRQVYPEYAERVEIAWRALSLEYVNQGQTARPTIRAELEALRRIEPDLPVQSWMRPDWEWPTTMWPAFEALACAQAQSARAGYAMSWALRYAFFAESRGISMRHELMRIAEAVAEGVGLDLARFEEDWDTGKYKASVLRESERGWRDLKVDGSATFVLPNGRQASNPGLEGLDFDEESLRVRSYKAPERDPLEIYRDLLEEAAG